MATYDILMYIGIACGILAIGFLTVSIAMFIIYRIPTLWKDSRGSLEQKQIEEIRAMRRNEVNNRNKVNVFEELEKKAKPRTSAAQSIRMKTVTGTESPISQVSGNKQGTVVLKKESKAINPDFIVEKDITFVCTSEVI